MKKKKKFFLSKGHPCISLPTLATLQNRFIMTTTSFANQSL